jgi:hypothetical protein
MTTTLRTASGDLVLPRVIVSDPIQVAAQTVRDGLNLWRGEWFLDQNAGFPWLMFLGQKIVNDGQLLNALRTFLLSVTGIVNVIAQATFDRVSRSFNYTYECKFNSNGVSGTIVGGTTSPATVQGS